MPLVVLACPDGVAQHADANPPVPQAFPQGPDLGVGERVRLPELLVRRQRRRVRRVVVGDAGLGQDLLDPRTAAVAAQPQPRRALGLEDPVGELGGPIRVVTRLRGVRLGVRPPLIARSRPCARASACRPSRRRPPRRAGAVNRGPGRSPPPPASATGTSRRSPVRRSRTSIVPSAKPACRRRRSSACRAARRP